MIRFTYSLTRNTDILSSSVVVRIEHRACNSARAIPRVQVDLFRDGFTD